MLQVYEPGKGLAFHFDKDELAMKERQQMVQPVLSSVLYLTGDSTTERLGKLCCNCMYSHQDVKPPLSLITQAHCQWQSIVALLLLTTKGRKAVHNLAVIITPH